MRAGVNGTAKMQKKYVACVRKARIYLQELNRKIQLMTPTYRIKNWNEHFEISQSRQCKGMKMSWVAIPNKHDGKSYRRLVRLPEFGNVFAAWILIIETASKQKVRGTLADVDGPITAEDLADGTGMEQKWFELAFEVLADDKIGWLETV